ncbi:MAG: MGMT family protein [Acidobacteriota bacterium]|nr:MGMT family protein [Acidobacteriota bacterium]
MNPFTSRVIAVVRRIPAGRVATYGDVADAAGQPRAARAVGNIMRQCAARDVPCHRVIAAGGRLGGFGGNEEMKRALLRAEGVLVAGSRIRDFSARRWAAGAGSARNRRTSPGPLGSRKASARET